MKVQYVCASALAALFALRPVLAQPLSGDRPLHLGVGGPVSGADYARGDVRRSGFARGGLARGPWVKAWAREIPSRRGTMQGPFEDGAGNLIVVLGGGVIVTISPEGVELSRVETHAGEAGPAALLADGTVVFFGSNGELIGVHGGAVVFRSRLVDASSAGKHGGPLPLESGGAMVSFSDTSELVHLDSRGATVARKHCPYATVLPLLGYGADVIAVGSDGGIYRWDGRGELRTLGRFDASPDVPPMIAGDKLIATFHGWLESFDLVTGEHAISARLAATEWVGPFGSNDRGELVGLSTSGAVLSFRLGAPRADLDAGTDPFSLESTLPFAQGPLLAHPMGDPRVPQRDLGPYVSSDGAVVFARTDGTLVRTSGGTMETAGPFCSSLSTHVQGIAIAHDGSVVVLCDDGRLTMVRGEPGKLR